MKSILFGLFLLTQLFTQFETKIIMQEEGKGYSIFGEELKVIKGSIAVPNNRSNPSYMITLPFIRVFSLNKNPNPPILYLAGGPGDPGITVGNSFFNTYEDNFLKHSDVIYFDQRGTGNSEPNLHNDEAIDIPLHLTLSDEAYWDALSEQIQQRITFVEEKHGIDIKDYNTQESVYDIEDLRKLLKVEKVTLWGHSYGSHLGFAYINQYEKNVAKAIFTGINGLDSRYRLPSESEEVLDRMNDYIQEDPYYSELIPDFKFDVKSLIEDFKLNPKKVNLDYLTAHNYRNKFGFEAISLWTKSFFADSVEVVVGELEFKLALMLYFQGTTNIFRVPGFIMDLKNGRYKSMAALVKRVLNNGGRNSPLTKNPIIYPMAISSHGSTSKIDSVKQEISSNEYTLSGVLNFPFINEKLQNRLNLPHLPQSFREDRKYQVPVLFLNGDLDIRTTLKHVYKQAEHFQNSQVVEVKKASHYFYALDDKVMMVMDDFLSSKPLRYTSINTNISFVTPAGNEPTYRRQLLNAFESGDLDSFDTLSEKLKAEGKIREYSLNNIGYYFFYQERFEEALHVFKMNAKLYPKSSNVYDSLGDVYYKLAKYDESEIQFKKSIEINKLNHHGYTYLGFIKRMRRKFAEEGL